MQTAFGCALPVKALLASRALLVKIKRDLENQVRGLLKNLGLIIFVKMHKTMRMTASNGWRGLATSFWSMTDLAELVDTAASKPGKRDPYKKNAGQNSN
jgi:hypothetical protein